MRSYLGTSNINNIAPWVHGAFTGILAIDEIDATLYPGSQVKLIESFVDICKDLKIQIIATTHSLQLLEKADKFKKSKSKKFNTIYLKKKDDKIIIDDNLDYKRIINNLNMSLGESAPPTPKLAVYTEDAECIHFVKAMLGRSIKDLDFSDISLGCGNYIQLASRKVPSFIFPNSIVVLDGDTRAKLKGKRLKNFICLPGELNPEGLLATFLHNLPESDNFWTLKNADYSKQYCFMDFSLEHILGDRKKAKLWYNRQLDTGNWGRGANVLYKAFLKTIPDEVDSFIEEFKKIYDSMTQSK